jgi:hypothetical protein
MSKPKRLPAITAAVFINVPVIVSINGNKFKKR